MTDCEARLADDLYSLLHLCTLPKGHDGEHHYDEQTGRRWTDGE